MKTKTIIGLGLTFLVGLCILASVLVVSVFTLKQAEANLWEVGPKFVSNIYDD